MIKILMWMSLTPNIHSPLSPLLHALQLELMATTIEIYFSIYLDGIFHLQFVAYK